MGVGREDIIDRALRFAALVSQAKEIYEKLALLCDNAWDLFDCVGSREYCPESSSMWSKVLEEKERFPEILKKKLEEAGFDVTMRREDKRRTELTVRIEDIEVAVRIYVNRMSVFVGRKRLC